MTVRFSCTRAVVRTLSLQFRMQLAGDFRACWFADVSDYTALVHDLCAGSAPITEASGDGAFLLCSRI